MKQELENVVKEEYPLVYERIYKTVIDKEYKDFEMRKVLFELYQQFTNIDVDKFTNTLTVADIKHMEDAPSMEELFSRAVVNHPMEELLNNFKNGNQPSDKESCDNSDIEFDDIKSEGIDALYEQLESR